MKNQEFSFSANWLLLAVSLYFFVRICWVPVVLMQIKMLDMAKLSAKNHTALSPLYWLMNRYWIILGALALPAAIVIFYLMVFKPDF